MSRAVQDALMTVLDEDHALAVIEHRRVTIKKPLTVFAAKLLAKRFAAWIDPNQAAEIMIEKVWQGFDASWMQNRPAPRHRQAGEAGGSPKTFDEGGHGPRGQTHFLRNFKKPQAIQ